MTPNMPRTRAIYTREKIMRPSLVSDWLLVLAVSSAWWLVVLLWATTP